MESFEQYMKSKEEQELINELIMETQYKEELWRFHPDNSKSIDVVASYAASKAKIAELEKRLKKF